MTGVRTVSDSKPHRTVNEFQTSTVGAVQHVKMFSFCSRFTFACKN